MIENRCSAYLRRLYKEAKSSLDHRAIVLCDQWITWADGFGIAPPADLATKLVTAELAAGLVIVRQITGKLATDCPIPMPMAAPASALEEESAGIEALISTRDFDDDLPRLRPF